MGIKKTFLIILSIIFLMIVGLGFVAYWQLKSFQKSLSGGNQLQFQIPDISFESREENEQKESYEDFVVPAGDLKITYSDSWQKIEPVDFNFEALSSEKVETLFYAIKTEAIKMKVAWLTVQKLDLGEEKNLEKFIEEIESGDEERQIEVEIQNLNIEEDGAEFEIIQTQSGYSLGGREKIILTKENAYSAMVFSLTSDWDFFQEEAEKILNSVQILPSL